MNKDPFEYYIKHEEASKNEKYFAWRTAIGLQDVDGLKPSEYLIQTAEKNIKGEISLDYAEELIAGYYKTKPHKDISTKEADIVSVRIAKLISEPAFSFTVNQYISIHKYLFEEIYEHAGRIRQYNMTKEEWILNRKSVHYANYSELLETIKYYIKEENNFSYVGLTTSQIVKHLAKFVSRIWQVHIFEEGNTRTTAVFFIKYLRTLGFDVTNDIFAENAWYFRNALVRANYNDLTIGVYETTEYLELFIRNLLLKEFNELKNRTMHIDYKKTGIEDGKTEINTIKADINDRKTGIERIFEFNTNLREKTKKHILRLNQEIQSNIFGLQDVMQILNLQKSASSALIKKMLTMGIIEKVYGKGKGRYVFRDKKKLDKHNMQ